MLLNLYSGITELGIEVFYDFMKISVNSIFMIWSVDNCSSLCRPKPVNITNLKPIQVCVLWHLLRVTVTEGLSSVAGMNVMVFVTKHLVKCKRLAPRNKPKLVWVIYAKPTNPRSLQQKHFTNCLDNGQSFMAVIAPHHLNKLTLMKHDC